jgi:hypothetical protein
LPRGLHVEIDGYCQMCQICSITGAGRRWQHFCCRFEFVQSSLIKKVKVVVVIALDLI